MEIRLSKQIKWGMKLKNKTKNNFSDGKVRLDMLISNGVLLIFSSGSGDLV